MALDLISPIAAPGRAAQELSTPGMDMSLASAELSRNHGDQGNYKKYGDQGNYRKHGDQGNNKKFLLDETIVEELERSEWVVPSTISQQSDALAPVAIRERRSAKQSNLDNNDHNNWDKEEEEEDNENVELDLNEANQLLARKRKRQEAIQHAGSSKRVRSTTGTGLLSAPNHNAGEEHETRHASGDDGHMLLDARNIDDIQVGASFDDVHVGAGFDDELDGLSPTPAAATGSPNSTTLSLPVGRRRRTEKSAGGTRVEGDITDEDEEQLVHQKAVRRERRVSYHLEPSKHLSPVPSPSTILETNQHLPQYRLDKQQYGLDERQQYELDARQQHGLDERQYELEEDDKLRGEEGDEPGGRGEEEWDELGEEFLSHPPSPHGAVPSAARTPARSDVLIGRRRRANKNREEEIEDEAAELPSSNGRSPYHRIPARERRPNYKEDIPSDAEQDDGTGDTSFMPSSDDDHGDNDDDDDDDFKHHHSDKLARLNRNDVSVISKKKNILTRNNARPKRVRQKPTAWWKNEQPERGNPQVVVRPKTPKKPERAKKKKSNASSSSQLQPTSRDNAATGSSNQSPVERNMGRFNVLRHGREVLLEVAKTREMMPDQLFKHVELTDAVEPIESDDDENVEHATLTMNVGFAYKQWKCGVLKVSPNSRKPSQNSTQYAEVFYVVNGNPQITLHNSEFKLSPGGFFFVPPYNTFEVSNQSSKECKLVFFMATWENKGNSVSTQ